MGDGKDGKEAVVSSRGFLGDRVMDMFWLPCLSLRNKIIMTTSKARVASSLL